MTDDILKTNHYLYHHHHFSEKYEAFTKILYQTLFCNIHWIFTHDLSVMSLCGTGATLIVYSVTKYFSELVFVMLYSQHVICV